MDTINTLIADARAEQQELRQRAEELGRVIHWLQKRSSIAAEPNGSTASRTGQTPARSTSQHPDPAGLSIRDRIARHLSDTGPKTRDELTQMLIADGCEDSDRTRKSVYNALYRYSQADRCKEVLFECDPATQRWTRKAESTVPDISHAAGHATANSAVEPVAVASGST